MAGTVNSASNELGPVWADPSLQLEDILKTSPTMEEAFDLALSKGFFSQYTAYQNRDFAAQVVA